MNKKRIWTILMAFLVTPMIALAELVTATSDPFTFPAIDNIRQNKSIAITPVFSSKGYSTLSHSMTLTWSIPVSINAKKGSITIFTLQGKALKTFDLTSRSGAVTWKLPRSQSQNGLLIARLSYGAHVSTLKLVLCR
jgi:hypothetical protein